MELLTNSILKKDLLVEPGGWVLVYKEWSDSPVA